MLAEMAIPQQMMTAKLPIVCSLVATTWATLDIGSFGPFMTDSVAVSIVITVSIVVAEAVDDLAVIMVVSLFVNGIFETALVFFHLY